MKAPVEPLIPRPLSSNNQTNLISPYGKRALEIFSVLSNALIA